MAEGKMDKRDVTLQVCDFSAKVYSTHRWRKTREYDAKEMTIFWCFYQPSRHCMNIMHNVCKLMQFKCCAIYGLSYLIHTNGNTCSVMRHCRKQLCSPLLCKFQFTCSYMRKFFCYRFNPSLRFFYFFVHCLPFCTPTSWMPGRGGYEYFHSHYDDWSIKHSYRSVKYEVLSIIMVNSASTAFIACFVWIASRWLTRKLGSVHGESVR